MRIDAPSYAELTRETPETLREKIAASPEEAARWIEAAAHAGSRPAILNWAQMLLDGHGIARDPQAAYRWFRIVAETGDPDGINMVGRCHENGWGTSKDIEEAARCYNLAAALGHAWARFNLGMLLVEGDGVHRDLKLALSLFIRAARQGNAKATNMIGRYCEEGWHGPAKPASAMRWYARAAVRGCFRGQFHLARFYAARGDIGIAKGWLERSFSIAPADFCREAAEVLCRHAHPEIRRMGQVASALGGNDRVSAVQRPIGESMGSKGRLIRAIMGPPANAASPSRG